MSPVFFVYLFLFLIVWLLLKTNLIPSPVQTEIRYRNYFVLYSISIFNFLIFQDLYDMREWSDNKLIIVIYLMDKYIIPMNIKIF